MTGIPAQPFSKGFVSHMRAFYEKSIPGLQNSLESSSKEKEVTV